MVTALVLQLIQCIIKVPEAEEKKGPAKEIEPLEKRVEQVGFTMINLKWPSNHTLGYISILVK